MNRWGDTRRRLLRSAVAASIFVIGVAASAQEPFSETGPPDETPTTAEAITARTESSGFREARPSNEAKPPGTDDTLSASRSIQDWYAMGGATMHGLVFCSALILALVFERSFVLRRSVFVPDALSKALQNAIEVGNRNEIKTLCESDPSVLARLGRIALEGPSARERLEAEGAAAAHQAHRNLPMLAALGNLATMLGLLGTVLGMVEAFDVIARVGTSDARVVAGGIFRALVTTAAGLGIGIFALATHSLFSRRASDFIVALETRLTEVVEEWNLPNRPTREPGEVEIL